MLGKVNKDYDWIRLGALDRERAQRASSRGKSDELIFEKSMRLAFFQFDDQFSPLGGIDKNW